MSQSEGSVIFCDCSPSHVKDKLSWSASTPIPSKTLKTRYLLSCGYTSEEKHYKKLWEKRCGLPKELPPEHKVACGLLVCWAAALPSDCLARSSAVHSAKGKISYFGIELGLLRFSSLSIQQNDEVQTSFTYCCWLFCQLPAKDYGWKRKNWGLPENLLHFKFNIPFWNCTACYVISSSPKE